MDGVAKLLTICCVLFAVQCEVVIAQEIDELAPFVEQILAQAEPEKPAPLLSELDDNVRTGIAFRLLNRGERLRDAVLTLATIRGEHGFESETEQVFESLGPKTREAVVPVLLQWLTGENAFLRLQARSALYYFDGVPVSVVSTLREMTRNKSAGTRSHACELLGRIGPAAVTAVPDLRRCLKDPIAVVRLAAAESIAVVDPTDRECVRVLGELTGNPERQVARNAARALGITGDRALEQPQIFYEALQSGSEDVRQAAGFALSDCGSGALPFLVKWLNEKDTSWRFKMAMIKTLEWMDGDLSSAGPAVLNVAKSSAGELRISAIRVFAQIGGFDAVQLVPFAVESANVRKTVAVSLAKCSEKSTPKATELLRGLMQDSKSSIRVEACASLCRLGVVDSGILEFITALLRDGSAREKMSAMKMVELIAPHAESIVPELIGIFASEEAVGAGFGGYSICQAAVRPVTLIGRPAVPMLLKGLGSVNSNVRGLSARALGEIGDPVALGALQKLLSDRDSRPVMAGCLSTEEEVRVVAINAIASVGHHSPELIPQLLELTKQDWSRTAAVRALGRLGPVAEKAIPVLLKLEDVNESGSEGFEVARAIARLRPSGSISLIGVRRVLKSVSDDESYLSYGSSGLADTIDLIVELGDRSKPLIPDLAFMVEEHELLHREHRIEAAYALAMIDSQNPKWRAKLEDWATRDSFIMNPATRRLRQLNQAARAESAASSK